MHIKESNQLDYFFHFNLSLSLSLSLSLPRLSLSLYIYLSIYLFLANFFKNIFIYIPDHWLVGRVFTNCPGNRGSIPGSHTKDPKMTLDTSMLDTRRYKIRIKGKVGQSSERGSTLSYTSV